MNEINYLQFNFESSPHPSRDLLFFYSLRSTITPYLRLPNLTLHYLTLPYLTSPYLTFLQFISPCLTYLMMTGLSQTSHGAVPEIKRRKRKQLWGRRQLALSYLILSSHM